MLNRAKAAPFMLLVALWTRSVVVAGGRLSPPHWSALVTTTHHDWFGEFCRVFLDRGFGNCFFRAADGQVWVIVAGLASAVCSPRHLPRMQTIHSKPKTLLILVGCLISCVSLWRIYPNYFKDTLCIVITPLIKPSYKERESIPRSTLAFSRG